ncbi:hypothetical protein ACK1EQ_002941 [Salmonella enterica]|nr:hypothetical protein [Salmonella enterica]
MEESNPWPTFVDAFSTVLSIFIFLTLLFILNSMVVMYESSQKVYAQFKAEVQQNSQSETVSVENKKQYSVSNDGVFIKDTTNYSFVILSKDKAIISYDPNKWQISEDNLKQVIDWIGSESNVRIVATNGSNLPVSDEIKIAYERAILLAKSLEINKHELKLSIEVASGSDSNNGQVIIYKGTK